MAVRVFVCLLRRVAQPPVKPDRIRLTCGTLLIVYTEVKIPLVCTYDSEANAAYVYLQHPIAAAEAVEQVAPSDPEQGMFHLDLNADGHVLGLEIIGAREHLPPALLRAILDHDPGRTGNTTR